MYTKLLQLSIKKQTSKFKAYITWHLYSWIILRYMWYALKFKFFFQMFFLLFSCRTASGGAQGAAANGAVEGQKPSGPPSVRHITIGPMSFWRSIDTIHTQFFVHIAIYLLVKFSPGRCLFEFPDFGHPGAQNAKFRKITKCHQIDIWDHRWSGNVLIMPKRSGAKHSSQVLALQILRVGLIMPISAI